MKLRQLILISKNQVLVVLMCCFGFKSIAQGQIFNTAGSVLSVNGTVSFHDNLTVANGNDFETYTSTRVLAKGNIAVTADSIENIGRTTITNTSQKTISGTLVCNRMDVTSGTAVSFASGINIVQVIDSLVLDGIIKTGLNNLIIGKSITNTGKIFRTNGHVNGNIRRWFGASTNSSVESSIFPFGGDAVTAGTYYYAPSTIKFTTAPSTGGHLTSKHTISAPNNVFVNLTDGSVALPQLSEMNIWQHEVTSGLSGGVYTISVQTDSIQGVTDVTQLRLAKRASELAAWTIQGTHIAGSGSVDNPLVQRSGLTTFSQFAITSPVINPLPVELLSFTATCEDDYVGVKWVTESEINADYFTLESSHNGFDWTVVNQQQANGTTFLQNDYFYNDSARNSALTYYRLKQFDLDGALSLEKIIVSSCEFSNEISFGLYPNPNNGDFNITVSSPFQKSAQIAIYSSEGKLIQNKNVDLIFGENLFPISLESISTGIYFVHLTIGTEIVIQKVSINK
ncbi:MAG: T9SS type A sorting domain-containing protein [Fluviicola sp.]|nr:T9SS type A sorting domain-containing protein [Fluviicola sp.]